MNDPLDEYQPGQWWLKSLVALWEGGQVDLDTRRAALVACDFAAKVFAARRAPAAAPAPVAASDNVHELDAAMSLLRVAQSLDTAKIAPAKLRDQVMQSVMLAAGANGKGEEYIFADVYENLSTMIAPHVHSGEPGAMHPFPASVVDTFTMLLEHYFAAPPAPAAAPIVQPDDRLDGVLRDMLAIQEACGLHTDEYAPGSVIEYIKELEADAAPIVQPALMRQAVATVVSRVGDELRIGWLRPERCDVGTLLYCATEAAVSAPIVQPVADERATVGGDAGKRTLEWLDQFTENMRARGVPDYMTKEVIAVMVDTRVPAAASTAQPICECGQGQACQVCDPIVPVQPMPACTLPPPGWYCTRPAGHDGPCAAWQNEPTHKE